MPEMTEKATFSPKKSTAAIPAQRMPEQRTVLVVDDDKSVRELLAVILECEGYLVVTAASGADALRLAAELRPDLITLDVMMPDMDGWSVLAALKSDEALRDIPVIMLTMIDDPARGFALGASDYATKPVNRRRLSQILEKYAMHAQTGPVLVVDDDATARQLTRGILEKEGWKVIEAENGVDALTAMNAENPSLIFLDLMMPEMDGFTFAAEVRRHPEWRSIPIVVLTAQDVTNDDRRRLSGNVETILRKHGDSRDAMLAHVRDLLTDTHTPRRTPENLKP